MKKIIATLIILLFVTIGYSQVQMVRVNIKKDTVLKKETVDSVKKVAVTKDAVIEVQKKDIEKKNDSLVNQGKKIGELQKATSQYFLGGKSIYFILFGLLWVLFGVIFSWCMKALIGMNDKANGTPTIWSWGEFFKPKNVIKAILSITASFIAAFAIMVFFDNITHLALTMFYCFGIGLVLDLIIYWLFKWRKKFSPINVDNDPNGKPPTQVVQ